MKAKQPAVAEDPFYTALNGYFTSLLRWEQLDAFWQVLRSQSKQTWYIYAVGETPPNTSASPEEFDTFIKEIDILLRKEHEEDYCAIVYAYDHESPSFIKIFDPNNLGVSCGFSENPPLPGWVLSKIQPVDLENALRPANNRRRWWQKIFE